MSAVAVDSPAAAEQRPRVRKPNANPKDGWKAFVVSVCASVVQACTFGVSNSFPNFVTEMTNDESLGLPTNSTMSLVQAVALGLAALFSIPAGIVVQRVGPRVANLISTAGLVLALILSSQIAKSGEAMIGLYSVPMGIAMGFMMSTGATATSSWFDKHAAIGMGICFTGGGTGSLIVPRIAGALTNNFDWRDSFCILIFLAGIQAICTIFVCMRPTDGDEEEGEEGAEMVGTSAADVIAPNQSNTDKPPYTEIDAAHQQQQQQQQVAVVSPAEADESLAAAAKSMLPFDYHHVKARTAYELFVGCLCNRNFLGLFACYAFFSIGFYGFLYIAVPFPLSMGSGPYVGAATQTVDQASNVFVSFGIMQTIGGPLLGWIATRSDERLVFIACMGLLAVTVSYYAICRESAEFIAVSGFMGFGISGFFSTFGTMIAQRFYGPNLSVIMSLGFAGAVFGGFLGSTISTEITNADSGNYTNATVFHSLSFFVAGLIVMFVVQDVADSDARLSTPIASAAEREQLIGGAATSPTAADAAATPTADRKEGSGGDAVRKVTDGSPLTADKPKPSAEAEDRPNPSVFSAAAELERGNNNRPASNSQQFAPEAEDEMRFNHRTPQKRRNSTSGVLQSPSNPVSTIDAPPSSDLAPGRVQ